MIFSLFPKCLPFWGIFYHFYIRARAIILCKPVLLSQEGGVLNSRPRLQGRSPCGLRHTGQLGRPPLLGLVVGQSLASPCLLLWGRSSLLGKEGFEDERGERKLGGEGGEKRKENNSWGVKVVNPFPPFLWAITMNFVRESESSPHNCFLCHMSVEYHVIRAQAETC